MGEFEAFWHTYAIDLLISCACAVLFMILLSLDALNAFKRRAYWIPAQALVLSAPTIQLLSFIDNKLNSSLHISDNLDLLSIQISYLLEDQLVINSRRIMICVIIGYLLPGMVSSSFTNLGSNIGALALTLIFHIASEVYFVVKLNTETLSPSPSPASSESYDYELDWENSNYKPWFLVTWAILFTVIILLVCLLSCAVLAGIPIRNIISRKVPSALECCRGSVDGDDKCRSKCRSIGDHVLKSWIVVRCCQPDYIMARSVFSSFVGLVVTGCIVLLAINWRFAPPPGDDYIEIGTHIIQFVFILIGWISILYRWLTAVMYFPRSLRCHWEDRWAKNIEELVKADLDAQSRKRLFRDKRLPKRARHQSGIASSMVPIWLCSLLLTVAFCLQKLMVSLSKACWCLSEIVFQVIRPLLFSSEKIKLLSDGAPKDTDPFSKYKEALEIIKMPGEIAYSLWIANESAFKKVERQMAKGFEKGKGSSELIKLKQHRTGDPHDEAAISVEEEKYFKQVGQTSWKMKAVSLIRFMIFYDKDAISDDIHKSIKDSIQAYSEAWPLMDIVDSSNPEANLVSEAADKEFDALEDIWKKPDKSSIAELLEEKINKKQLCHFSQEGDLKLLSEEQEDKARKCQNYKDTLHDNMDWMKSAAAKISLYKTRKVRDLDRAHSIERLRCLLANAIFHCIDMEVDKAIIANCNKWAKEGNENDIFEAAFIAGIAEGVKEKIGQGKVQPEVDDVDVDVDVEVEVVVAESSQVSSRPGEIIEHEHIQGE